MPEFEPAYIKAHEKKILEKRIEKAGQILKSCTLCPRKCHVDRLAGETGICNTGYKAWVSSYGPHFGEEEPLVGKNGSGTIFFTHCNLLCLFCQNFDISHKGGGDEITPDQLAWIMLNLQGKGCHNINFVTPSHVVPQILMALELAIPKGLSVPIVYNSGGYDNVETLKLLEGIVDIYMPDFKFWSAEVAKDACNAPDYPEAARRALIEMHRQVGDLKIENGIAVRGLLVRHLVLPQGLSGTKDVMDFIATHVSKNTYVNIMRQYRPLYRAFRLEGFNEYPSAKDYENAVSAARKAGIKRLDQPKRVFMIS